MDGANSDISRVKLADWAASEDSPILDALEVTFLLAVLATTIWEAFRLPLHQSLD